MKYVLLLLVAIAPLARANNYCKGVVSQFIVLLAQDKKSELLKLVAPESSLYRDLKEDRYKSYTMLGRDRLAHYQFIYNNAFAVDQDKEFKVPGVCRMQIFGLDGGERYFIGFAHVVQNKKLIEAFALGSDR